MPSGSSSADSLAVALASPLWWPGLQVIALSHRTHDTNYVGLPGRAVSLLLAQGYYGLPTGPPISTGFGLKYWNYYESVAYVGVLAIVLGVVRGRPLLAPSARNRPCRRPRGQPRIVLRDP